MIDSRIGIVAHRAASLLTAYIHLNAEDSILICNACDERFCNANDCQRDSDGDAICQDCFSDSYCYCQNCGVVLRNEDAHQDDDGDTYCERHLPEREEEEEDSGDLLEHNVRINRRKEMFLRHASERKADLFLGWELECYPSEGKRHTLVVQRVRDVFGEHCIVKRDGSLGSGGLEVVSIAATLKWHQEHARKFLENVKGELSGWKHNDCGIHVHVGLAETTKLQRARCATFIGDQANQKFLNHIAGRDANNYAMRYKKKLVQPYRRDSRYGALNFARLAARLWSSDSSVPMSRR
jgi:hypothetical protein